MLHAERCDAMPCKFKKRYSLSEDILDDDEEEEEEAFHKCGSKPPMCLGLELHANKALTHGVSKLVSAANKAMHAMNHRCAFLHILTPIASNAAICKLSLFDSLLLPILNLSHVSEVWAVDGKVGESAEQLHRQFLKHVLGVRFRGNTATPIVLAEFGRCLLRFHWSQQILRYGIRVVTVTTTVDQ